MKGLRIIKSKGLVGFLVILLSICFFSTNAEGRRIKIKNFSDSAVAIDFSDLPNIHDYPSPISEYENISDIGVTFYVITEATPPTFRTSGFDEGIGTNIESDAIEAVFSTPVLRAGAVVHVSKAMVSAYDENNNLLEQHYASEVFYESFSNNVKEFVGIQNQAGIKRLVFEDVELNGRIIVVQDFIFESRPVSKGHGTGKGRKVPAPVPQTGQTDCYDTDGNIIDCAGTGQDGEYQYGTLWPDPRFTDNGNGTVTDNLTGLIWLKNANCFGGKEWATALTDANGLASGSCGLTDGSSAGDWRLPNLRELHSLIDLSNYTPALPSVHPFTGVQGGGPASSEYWSSSTFAKEHNFALNVSMYYGYVLYSGKTEQYYVWPVRGGN